MSDESRVRLVVTVAALGGRWNHGTTSGGFSKRFAGEKPSVTGVTGAVSQELDEVRSLGDGECCRGGGEDRELNIEECQYVSGRNKQAD